MKNNRLLLIILISLMIICAVILTNFFSFVNIEEVIIEQIKDNQLTETEHAAGRMENHILQVKDELATLSRFPSMKTLDINECSGDMKVIHEQVEGKIDSLLRVDSEGNVIECSSPKFSNYVGLNIKNKEYFITPRDTKEAFISGIVRQGVSKQIIISAPLFDSSEYASRANTSREFKGLLLSIIEMDNLYNLYLHPIIDSEENLFLLINTDSEETIIGSDELGEYSEIKDRFPITNNGLDTIADFNGFGETIITSSDIILGPETLRLIILTPRDNIGQELESVQKRHLFSLGFVIITIIATFLFLISIYKSKEEVQLKLDKASVTLEKFGINIEVEKDKYSQADVSLDAKKIYLIKEDEENQAYELFVSSLNRGFAGLGIIRDDPREIKKKYNLKKTSFIWLTKTKVDNLPCETDIDNLFELISEFIKKSRKSVVLLDRLDYILTENKFENVIKKLHALKDLALANECIILLSANPELIKQPQLKSIEAETIDLFGKHLKNKVELTSQELDILRFINDANIINKLASYKDITGNFKITKPTTRVKINKLQRLGLLNIEQKGRFKSLKITSAGRRIIG